MNTKKVLLNKNMTDTLWENVDNIIREANGGEITDAMIKKEARNILDKTSKYHRRMSIGFSEYQYRLLKAAIADSDFTFASLVRKLIFDPNLPPGEETEKKGQTRNT
jgi:hypothetical protein